MTRYRPEIDGLRAIAVLAVILFHARVPGFTGGYAGVDVFFVISGYLITQAISQESASGRFSLLRFYERRVRRIMPALFAMLAVSCIAALLLLPPDLRRSSAVLTSVIAFLSNFLLWRWSGYSEPSANSMPFLHTWSLAVEEQFYLVFPILLMLLYKAGRRWVPLAILSIALASFGHSVWATHHNLNLAFYSPLSRAWELMAGALLATAVLPAVKHRFINDALAGLGLLLVGYSFFHLTQTMPFPGVNALAPCVGTAMILHATQDRESHMTRVLSWKPVVTIGLASYSLYLWHWPLMVFSTYYVLDPHSASLVRIAMAVATFPIAFLSWRFIERPFRGPQGLLSRNKLFAHAFALSAVFVALGSIGYAMHGLPWRFDSTVQKLSAAARTPNYICANQPMEDMRAGRFCVIGEQIARPSFVIWGDSHANVFHRSLDTMARSHSVAGYNMTTFGCPPVLGLQAQGSHMNECLARNELIMRTLSVKRPRAVILAAHWPAYIADYRRLDEPDEAGQNDIRRKHGRGYTVENFRVALANTVDSLRQLGATVYFLEDVPVAAAAKPDVLAKAYLLGSTKRIEPSVADYTKQNAFIRAAALALERQGALQVLAPERFLCDTVACRITDGSDPLYYDSNHLNERGARLVSLVFEPMLRQLSP